SINFQNLLDAVAGKTPIVFIRVFDNLTLLFHNLALYAAEAWRPTAKLTLSLGLRWELNPPPSGTGSQSLYTLVGLNNLATARVGPPVTPLYGTTYTNFAPRFGVAYQIAQRPGREMVVRGGFGIFYDLGTGVIGESAESFPHARGRTV